MWCRLAGISGCLWPRRGPHCPHWCPPRGPCGRLSLQVGCQLGCPPGLLWPPGWHEQLPVGLPGREMLTLTAGVRSPPALGRAVAPPTLGSCLMGSSWPGACDPRPRSLQKSPTTSWDAQTLGRPAGRASPLRGEGLGWSLWGHRILPALGGATPKLNMGPTWVPGGASPGPWVFLIPPMGVGRWWDRSGPGPGRPGCCAAGLGSPSEARVCPLVPGGAHTGVHSPADAHSPHLGYEPCARVRVWASRAATCLDTCAGPTGAHGPPPRSLHASPLSQPTPEPPAAPEPAALPSKQDRLVMTLDRKPPREGRGRGQALDQGQDRPAPPQAAPALELDPRGLPGPAHCGPVRACAQGPGEDPSPGGTHRRGPGCGRAVLPLSGRPEGVGLVPLSPGRGWSEGRGLAGPWLGASGECRSPGSGESGLCLPPAQRPSSLLGAEPGGCPGQNPGHFP